MPKSECIFCQIIKGEIPSDLILETNDLIVINDVHPKAPIHYLIIPKKHYQTADQADPDFFKQIPEILQKLISKNDALKNNYKLIINNGQLAGQEIMHLHIHILSGFKPGQLPLQGR